MSNPPIGSSAMALLTNKSRAILVVKKTKKIKSGQPPPNHELSPDKGLRRALTTKLCRQAAIFAYRQLIKSSRRWPFNGGFVLVWVQVEAVPLSVFPHTPMAPIQIARPNAPQTREWHTGTKMINDSD